MKLAVHETWHFDGCYYEIVGEGAPVDGLSFKTREDAQRYLEANRASFEVSARAPLTAEEEREWNEWLGPVVLKLDTGWIPDPEAAQQLKKLTASDRIKKPHSDELRAAIAAVHARAAAFPQPPEPQPPRCPCESGKAFVDCHASSPHALGINAKSPCPCGRGSRFENCHGFARD